MKTRRSGSTRDGAIADEAAQALGLPGPLPAGETILWQGAPHARTLAREALHARVVALYFGIAAILEVAAAWSQGWRIGLSAAALAIIALSAGAVLGLVWTFAVLIGRTTRYAITNRRVVMRIGVALPVTLNLPFAVIESAALRPNTDGTGDIPLALCGTGRISFLHLWPHARPWRVSRPQPMLRAVPDAHKVAAILSRALGSGQLGQAAAARQDGTSAPSRPAASAAAA